MQKFLGAVIILFALTLIGVSVAGAQVSTPLELADKVANFYDKSLGIGAILALGIITYAGILYTISAGNPSRQSEARKWLTSALLGLLLLFGSFVVMATINPELTALDDVLIPDNLRRPFTTSTLPEDLELLNEDDPPPFCVEKGNRCNSNIECCNNTCLGPGICDPAVDDPTDLDPQCREVCEIKLGVGAPECVILPPCPEVFCPVITPGYSNGWLHRRSGSGGTCPDPRTGIIPPRNHTGTDVGIPSISPASCGKPVFAIETGTLRNFRNTINGCGIQFQLFADSGKWYRYCHLQSYASGISEGFRVIAGEHIAYNGDTGNPNPGDCHIHFEVAGWAAGCSRNLRLCTQNPGCYTGLNNPVPVLNYACGLNIPVDPGGFCRSNDDECDRDDECCSGSCQRSSEPGVFKTCQPADPACNVGTWVNGLCGGGSCRDVEREQTRTVDPLGCEGNESSQCVSSTICSTSNCADVGESCSLNGDCCGNNNCQGGVCFPGLVL